MFHALHERLRRIPLRARLVLLTAGMVVVFVWTLALVPALFSALFSGIAFAPEIAFLRSTIVVAVLLTLVSIFIVRWMAQRMLLPLEEAGWAMQRMSDGEAPLAPLPIRREDEVGRMIGHFNRLIEDRARQEVSLKRMNRALRLLSECNAVLIHAGREQSLLDEICRLIVDSGGGAERADRSHRRVGAERSLPAGEGLDR